MKSLSRTQAVLPVELRDFPHAESITPVDVGDISPDGGGNPGFVLRGFDANALRLPSVKLLLEISVRCMPCIDIGKTTSF